MKQNWVTTFTMNKIVDEILSSYEASMTGSDSFAKKSSMMRYQFASALAMLLFSMGTLFAQPAERKLSRQEYINTYSAEAVKQMQMYGIPASITLAQGVLESSDGNSALARYANNHFGIKCHKWDGGTYYQDDDAPNECFRKYKSVMQSYSDHSEFLSTRSRYDFLFTLKPTDYKGWAHGLKKAGYATNPKYAHLLIRIIEENNLQQYDQLSAMPVLASKVTAPKAAELELGSRSVKVHSNGVRYILAEPGDSYEALAHEFDMAVWQLYRYNDLNPGDGIGVGDVVYIQAKRGKAKKDSHEVKQGETMRDISQMYGVRIKRLYAKNHMRPGTEPRAGQKISLRKRLPNPWATTAKK